jgi:ADP-ribosyl-[dinitrogen reductase] hydrolase
MAFSPQQKMLLGIAIGDAYGAGYEFRYPDLKDYQNISLEKYVKSAFPDFNHLPGMYTDDTQMSIAVAELLAGDKEFNKENLADKFFECYARDKIKGIYAKGFQAFLDSIASGKEFLEKINPVSIKNGAAMRAVPIGLIYDIDEVVEYATINASLTHNTSKGAASSVAVALMSHLHFYAGFNSYNDDDLNKALIKHAIIRKVEKIDKETGAYMMNILYMNKLDPLLLLGAKHFTKGVPCDGMRTIGAVFYLLNNFRNPKDILTKSIKLGGDTDSVASISLGINMMRGSINDLPEFLYTDLTNHEYGRDYLLSLGSRLEAKFPQP